MRRTAAAAICLTLAIFLFPSASAQQRGRGAPPPPAIPRNVAPVDVAGTYVSVVTEDWRWRMVTPRKGDYTSLPISAEGRRVADAWDIAKDEAAGEACKPFGVGGIIRQPGRIQVAWQDDQTLKVDFDAGTQTRMLSFDKSKRPGAEKTWQGYSTAEWEGPVGRGAGPGGRGGDGRTDARLLTGEAAARAGGGTGFAGVPGGGGAGLRGGPGVRTAPLDSGIIKVTTSNFREGYLRKNGVPYSENAQITEYFQWLPPHPNGDVWLVVTTAIEDSKYLTQPFYTSTHFKKEANASKWSPSPCKTDSPAPPVK